MKLRTLVALAAVGLAGGSFLVERAEAAPFNPAAPLGAKKKAKAAGKAGKMSKTIALAPRGLKWGLGLEQVASLYDKYFEAQYAVRMADVPLGPQSDALTAELNDKKDLARRTKLKFGTQQTGLDATALKGEYSYANNESLSKTVLAGGLTRYFFFFGDRLWKVYDEHALKAGGPLGADYPTAVATLKEAFGAEPKQLEPDFDGGRQFAEAHWTDGTTMIRAINREHEQIVAIAWIDQSVQSKLHEYRKNRPRQDKIDRDVMEATGPGATPEKSEKSDKKKK